jgi:hypothetical protein
MPSRIKVNDSSESVTKAIVATTDMASSVSNCCLGNDIPDPSLRKRCNEQMLQTELRHQYDSSWKLHRQENQQIIPTKMIEVIQVNVESKATSISNISFKKYNLDLCSNHRLLDAASDLVKNMVVNDMDVHIGKQISITLAPGTLSPLPLCTLTNKSKKTKNKHENYKTLSGDEESAQKQFNYDERFCLERNHREKVRSSKVTNQILELRGILFNAGIPCIDSKKGTILADVAEYIRSLQTINQQNYHKQQSDDQQQQASRHSQLYVPSYLKMTLNVGMCFRVHSHIVFAFFL